MTQVVTTEWPWAWHPDIHWYHQYLNLSSVGPEIWDGLHLGVRIGYPKLNESHPAVGWISQMPPNYTAVQLVYKEEYEGTGRNMLICSPQLVGKYPVWFTFEHKFFCYNFTPEYVAFVKRLKEFGFIYNREKPMVDIAIGIATAVTTFGIPGKTANYFSLFYNEYW